MDIKEERVMTNAWTEKVKRWRELAEPLPRNAMGHHVGMPTPEKTRIQWQTERNALAAALLEACDMIGTLGAALIVLEQNANAGDESQEGWVAELEDLTHRVRNLEAGTGP